MNNSNEKLLVVVLYSVIIMFFSCKKDNENDCKHLQITNKTINVTKVSDTTITIQWKEARYATYYKVTIELCGPVNYAPGCFKEYTCTTPSFTVSELKANTEYYLNVYAYNECSSGNYNRISATTSDGYSDNLGCLSWGDSNDNELNFMCNLNDSSFITVGNNATIVKFNEKGNPIWKKRLDNNYDIIEVIPYVNNSCLILSPNVIYCIDENGNSLYKYVVYNQQQHEIKKIEKTIDNDIVIVGNVSASNGLNTGDLEIVKINQNGTIIWGKTIGTDVKDNIIDVEVTDDNSILILFYSTYYNNKYASIVKLNQNGEIVWAKKVLNSIVTYVDYGRIKKIPNQNEYIVSMSKSDQEIFIFKILDNGNITWASNANFYASNWAYMADMTITNDAGCIITGTLSNNNTSGFAIRFSSSGIYLWSKYFKKGHKIEVKSIINQLNSYIIGGYIFTTKPNEMSVNDDFFFVKINENNLNTNCDCFNNVYIPSSWNGTHSVEDILMNQYSFQGSVSYYTNVISTLPINAYSTIYCE
ncbi:MAG: fibronectin type III domain-containing protein [Bacteroidales bacterium]|nr:fibronectin type III domain-containing protein [Bacteroidales bacterium]